MMGAPGMLRARVAPQDGMMGGERWDLYGMEGKAGTPVAGDAHSHQGHSRTEARNGEGCH